MDNSELIILAMDNSRLNWIKNYSYADSIFLCWNYIALNHRILCPHNKMVSAQL